MARLPIASEYVERERGDELAAAFQFALDLMRGQADVFKAGYDPASAVVTTNEAFAFDGEKASTLARLVAIHDAERGS